MDFVDSIDTESVAFKYFNSLNEFRYQYEVSKLLSSILFFDKPFLFYKGPNQIAKITAQLWTIKGAQAYLFG